MSETQLSDLSGEDMAAIGRRGVEDARRKHFEAGQPVSYTNEEGVLVREYADGTIQPVFNPDGSKTKRMTIFAPVAAE